MEMRVATFALSDQMITAALRTQSIMANEQIQESSGVTSEDFAGYGSDTQSIVNLQVSVTRAQTYIDAATQADSKVQVTYSAVGSVSTLITNLRSQLTAATTGSSTDTASLISSAQDMLQEMGSILNTQYDGQYVFSGASTSTEPVDLAGFDTGTGSLSTANTSYYQGDDEIASVRVADDQSVDYGVTADNSAFEQVMRVLRYIANSTSLSSSDISSALNLASSALDATSIVQSKHFRMPPRRSRAQAHNRPTTRTTPPRLEVTSPVSMSRPLPRSCRPISRNWRRLTRRSPRSIA
jgi:flagellar hook-associated protein 3 FlgL